MAITQPCDLQLNLWGHIIIIIFFIERIQLDPNILIGGHVAEL